MTEPLIYDLGRPGRTGVRMPDPDVPATAIPAPLIAPFEGDDKLYNKMDGLILRNTMFGNQFDLTAISLPVPGTALPVGLMLVARHGHDRRLLEIAAGVETLLARGA